MVLNDIIKKCFIDIIVDIIELQTKIKKLEIKVLDKLVDKIIDKFVGFNDPKISEKIVVVIEGDKPKFFIITLNNINVNKLDDYTLNYCEHDNIIDGKKLSELEYYDLTYNYENNILKNAFKMKIKYNDNITFFTLLKDNKLLNSTDPYLSNPSLYPL
jgi:hypothetical protein